MNKPNLVLDCWIMFKRCMMIVLKNGEAVSMALITPIFLMLLFGAVFGNIADVGPYSYVSFIVPGIILQAVGQASQYAAINVNTDMQKGMVDRFRSMPIAPSSLLIGHASAAIVRNLVTTVAIIITALFIGFAPQATFIEWLLIAGLLFLSISAITFFAVWAGLKAKSPESSGGIMFPLFILPFVSSGFAPTETMHAALRWFAEYQPMTPIINAIRALMLGFDPGNDLWIAIAWTAGASILMFVLSLRRFKRKIV